MLVYLSKRHNFIDNDVYDYVWSIMECMHEADKIMCIAGSLMFTYNQLQKAYIGSEHGVSTTYWEHRFRFPANEHDKITARVVKASRNNPPEVMFGILMLICYDIRKLELKHADSITWSK